MKAQVKITLNDTIERTDKLTRNKIAVEGRIRPATVSDLCNGKSKSISFETLTRIVDALDVLDDSRRHKITDVLIVEEEN